MKQISKQLTELMATINEAFYKSRQAGAHECYVGQLRVHQNDTNRKHTGITIDLYNFEGDGEPVCDGLDFECLCPADMQLLHQRAWCIAYDPEWESYPVLVLCSDTTGADDDFELNLSWVPDEVQQTIYNWLNSKFSNPKN